MSEYIDYYQFNAYNNIKNSFKFLNKFNNLNLESETDNGINDLFNNIIDFNDSPSTPIKFYKTILQANELLTKLDEYIKQKKYISKRKELSEKENQNITLYIDSIRLSLNIINSGSNALSIEEIRNRLAILETNNQNLPIKNKYLKYKMKYLKLKNRF